MYVYKALTKHLNSFPRLFFFCALNSAFVFNKRCFKEILYHKTNKRYVN